MIAITFDVDWAPNRIVEDVVSMLDVRGIPATLFCTNYTKDASGNSSNLASRLNARHEVALHPDFQHTADYGREWGRIVELYPMARGWRSHNGVTGWPITRDGVARGLRYEVFSSVFSDYVVPSQVNGALKGYYALTTAFWDSHRLHDASFSWTAADLPLRRLFHDERKLVVLGFHPNILYYDMRTAMEYDNRKPSYHQVAEQDCYRHRPLCGAMRLLTELLNEVPVDKFTTISAFGKNAGYW